MKISFGKLDFDGYILIWSHRTEWQFILAFGTHFSGAGWALDVNCLSDFTNTTKAVSARWCYLWLIDKKNKVYRMIRTIVHVRKRKPRE